MNTKLYILFDHIVIDVHNEETDKACTYMFPGREIDLAEILGKVSEFEEVLSGT